jgi:hypothetical protein
MSLTVPLSQEQVKAASRLHQRLEQWHQADAALLRLNNRLPGFDADACLLKTITINALYGTHVLAVGVMAKHVERVMTHVNLNAAGCELVDLIADYKHPQDTSKKTSFAAKFCHFFVDKDKFPIYDEAARVTLNLHIRSKRKKGQGTSSLYATFCERFNRLHDEAALNCSCRELDRYLWITGMYEKWQKGRNKPKFSMNVELRRVFEQPTIEEKADLDAMLPAILKRVCYAEV